MLSVGCSLLLPAMTSSSAEHTRPAERPVAHGCWRVTSLPGPCPSSAARSTRRASRDSPLTRRKRGIHPHSPSRVSLSSRPVSGCSVAVPTGPLQRSRARPRCGRSLRYRTLPCRTSSTAGKWPPTSAAAPGPPFAAAEAVGFSASQRRSAARDTRCSGATPVALGLRCGAGRRPRPPGTSASRPTSTG